jgi:hypothetical protein
MNNPVIPLQKPSMAIVQTPPDDDPTWLNPKTFVV